MHKALRGQTWNLVETAACLLDIGIAEIVEVCGEALGTEVLKDGTDGELSLGRIPYLTVAFTLLVLQVVLHGVLLEVDIVNEGCDILVLNLVEIGHDGGERTVVDVIAEYLLKGHLVAIGDGNIVHLIAETQDETVVGVGPTGADALPYGDVLLGLGILPVSDDCLAGLAQTGENMSIFAVAVGTLVQIHEVHIHCVVRNGLVVLCVEVEQRFLELLQTVYPHFGGRESVHPCDDADTVLIGVGSHHNVLNLMGVVGCTFIYNLHGQVAGVVKSVDHLLGVTVNLFHGIASIEELCARYKPYFVIFECFNHSFKFMSFVRLLLCWG